MRIILIFYFFVKYLPIYYFHDIILGYHINNDVNQICTLVLKKLKSFFNYLYRAYNYNNTKR